jgi:uncharacterized RDD family membrane protein YckC
VIDRPPLTAASWGRRLGAFVFDEAFVLLVARLAVYAVGLHHTVGGHVLWFVMATAYFALLNGSEAGQTFGKRLFGIAVRDAAGGGAIGPARAAMRYIVVGMFSIIVFFLLFTALDGLWPLWDPERQALHDKIAGSLVVDVTAT